MHERNQMDIIVATTSHDSYRNLTLGVHVRWCRRSCHDLDTFWHLASFSHCTSIFNVRSVSCLPTSSPILLHKSTIATSIRLIKTDERIARVSPHVNCVSAISPIIAHLLLQVPKLSIQFRDALFFFCQLASLDHRTRRTIRRTTCSKRSFTLNCANRYIPVLDPYINNLKLFCGESCACECCADNTAWSPARMYID